LRLLGLSCRSTACLKFPDKIFRARCDLFRALGGQVGFVQDVLIDAGLDLTADPDSNEDANGGGGKHANDP
jgi:hypothetical protein